MDKALELWAAAWTPDMTEDDYAKKRIKSAQSKKLTPILIDRNDLFGYFQGSHGKYETFLDTCSCGDFIRSKRPCKHIFRLAMELGVMGDGFETDKASIPAVLSEQTPLEEMVNIVEKLPESVQRTLLYAIRNMTSKEPCKDIIISDDLNVLFAAGILEKAGEPVIVWKNKSDLVKTMEDAGLEVPKMKFEDLKDYCLKNCFSILEKYDKRILVKCSDSFNRSKLHKYLHRKYDTFDYINDNGTWEHVPLLETVLPDDDVTTQLIKFGYGKKIGMNNITSNGIMFGNMNISLSGGVDK